MGDPAENALVFGVLRGKNVPAILDALAPLAVSYTHLTLPTTSVNPSGPVAKRASR